MVEHVGIERLGEYFDRCVPRAQTWRIVSQSRNRQCRGCAVSWHPRSVWRRLWKRDQFIRRYVFPDGDLVSVSAVLSSAEGQGFEMRDVESLARALSDDASPLGAPSRGTRSGSARRDGRRHVSRVAALHVSGGPRISHRTDQRDSIITGEARRRRACRGAANARRSLRLTRVASGRQRARPEAMGARQTARAETESDRRLHRRWRRNRRLGRGGCIGLVSGLFNCAATCVARDR